MLPSQLPEQLRDLHVSAKNVLCRLNVRTINDFIQKTDAEFLCVKGCGMVMLQQFQEKQRILLPQIILDKNQITKPVTWKQFKKFLKKNGVTDNMLISHIDFYLNDAGTSKPVQVEINKNTVEVYNQH